jgi:glycosyltransferase involved in cell wall biosynthesis
MQTREEKPSWWRRLRKLPAFIEGHLHQLDLAGATRLLLRLAGAHRRKPRIARSLWAGTPINFMGINARAERFLGTTSESLVYHTYYITQEFDYNLSRWMRLPIVRVLLPYAVFAWACLRYQRFHFFPDAGLLPPPRLHQINPAELDILRELGKDIFFWTYGNDVRSTQRTKDLGPYNCCMECPHVGYGCICDDARSEELIASLKRYGAIFSMGDMIEYTPGSRNDLFFWPVDLAAEGGQRYAPRYPDSSSTAPVRVIHAPNHRHYKGTRFLLNAVDKLQREGLPLELKLVERVPNRQALDIYRTADIIFDQCIIGFHGYFAQEAMALGKPVMVYIRDPERYLLHPEENPLINTHPERVEAVLRELIADRLRLHQLGVQGRRYIEKYHTLQAFAGRLRAAYEDLGVSWGSEPQRVPARRGRLPQRSRAA